MRRIISVLAVATMMAMVLLTPGMAVAQEKEEDYASKFCKEHDDFGLKHDFCVRVYQEYQQSEDDS